MCCKCSHRIFWGLLLVTFSIQTMGQGSLTELRRQQKELEKEIQQNTEMLRKTEKRRKNTVGQIYLLERQIRNREKLIKGYEQEISMIGEDIRKKIEKIDSLERRLEILRKEYAEIIRKYYEVTKSTGGITAYIFAAEDLNQAYKRLRYYQQFIRYSEQLYGELIGMKKNLEEEVQALRQARTEREEALEKLKREQQKLVREKNRKNRYVQVLKRKEKEIKKQIREKRRIKKRLAAAMARIMEEERKKRANGIALTPEEKIIDGNFSKNMGKLPWPTERGVVIEGFGIHRHPVLKNITVRNDGIDIMTEKNAKARAVFEGEVRKIIAIPGANETVIIRHGNFYTVYQNVYKVSVKAGEHVKTKQPIGTVFTDSKSGETILHFEIWQGMKKLDPEKWLAGKK